MTNIRFPLVTLSRGLCSSLRLYANLGSNHHNVCVREVYERGVGVLKTRQ